LLTGSVCHDRREVASSEIVGRGGELGYLYGFLDRPDREVRALVLEGEAGIGKSMLWTAGVAAARERGFQVLSSRPAEAERGLPHVVLADLLEGVAEEMLPSLSPPRRLALEGALLMDRSPGDALDPRALGVAVRTCFQVLAAQRPLVLAIDDIQWVDPSSAQVLAFALRRLHAERTLLLLARRLDERREGLEIEEALETDALERLRVGPLSIGATRLLLQRGLGRQFARPTLLRLFGISGGNPFYALELARGLPSAGATGDPTEPFPVPETLERLVGARLAGLGSATHEALLLTAAHGRPTPALLVAAGICAEALEPAFAAHVVELSDAVVRFTHPLLASILYQRAPDEERRKAHERLAAIVEDPVERARHLALSSDAADELVAGALEEAADLARGRAAIGEAAELAEHALRLTPLDALEDRHRRTIAAARAYLEAADTHRAQALAVDLVAWTHARGRAAALVLLSDIENARAHLERAIDLRREALEAAAGLPVLEVEIHEWLGATVRMTEGAAAGDRHAVTALELAEALGDESIRAGALSVLAFGRFRAGVSGGLSQVEEAAELAMLVDDPRQRRKLISLALNPLVWSHRLDRARALVESLDRDWSDRDELAKASVFWWLGMIELRCGRFPVAADYAERVREIRRQYTIYEPEETNSVWLAALIAAHRGELERARTLMQADLPLTENMPVQHSGDAAVLGLVELWSGRPGEAAARFAAADAERRGNGINEPAMFWWRADYAEALLARGKVDEAATLVDTWEAEAERLGREAVLAEMRRCRGLVAAARGEIEEALAELKRAVAQHEAVGDPFGRARAARFCRARIKGLTPAEGRIAALVAEGRTNREVAAALYLTEQTVATALTRVYRKLDVRSRTELARRLSGETQEPKPAKT